jgi:RNA polymerase sigma factor (sigma-70 family)
MTEAEVAKLYARHGYTVFRRCLVYLGETEDAQAAVQEVFLRALKGTAAIRGEADRRTWLCRIADQLCVDRLRRERRNPASPERDDAAAPLGAIEDAVAHDDPGSLVSVRRIAVGLDPESVRLAVLYFFDELTREELKHELRRSRRYIDKRVQQLLERARVVLPPKSAS